MMKFLKYLVNVDHDVPMLILALTRPMLLPICTVCIG